MIGQETLLACVKAIGVIILVFCFWIWVQNRWRKSFPDPLADEDVLAARKDCHGCIMHAGPCAERSSLEAAGCSMRPMIQQQSRALSINDEEIS